MKINKKFFLTIPMLVLSVAMNFCLFYCDKKPNAFEAVYILNNYEDFSSDDLGNQYLEEIGFRTSEATLLRPVNSRKIRKILVTEELFAFEMDGGDVKSFSMK